jgi:hypothetical protein
MDDMIIVMDYTKIKVIILDRKMIKKQTVSEFQKSS